MKYALTNKKKYVYKERVHISLLHVLIVDIIKVDTYTLKITEKSKNCENVESGILVTNGSRKFQICNCFLYIFSHF